MNMQVIGAEHQRQIERSQSAKARIYGDTYKGAVPANVRREQLLMQKVAELEKKLENAFQAAEMQFQNEIRNVDIQNLELTLRIKALRSALIDEGHGRIVDTILKNIDLGRVAYSAASIMNAVSVVSNIMPHERHSERRGADLVHWRMIEAYLLRKHTSRSLPGIGKLLGNRDHSTIMHGLKKIQEKFHNYKDDIARVEALL